MLRSRVIAVLMIALTTLGAASDSNGVLVGQLRILALKEVAKAEDVPAKPFATNYSDYPLVVLSQDGKKEIAKILADESGNYRVSLPAGVYILDVQRRGGNLRARPQLFTVVPNQTVRADFDIDTGVR